VTAESLILEAEEIRSLAVKAEQYSAATAALREKGILSGARIERQLTKAQVQHVESVEDLDDFSLIEQRVRLTLRMAEELGLDPSAATVEEYCNAMLDVFESGAEERVDYGRPAVSVQGVRAEGWAPKKREFTKGEAERLARRNAAPKIINGVANGRR
jgi:hypothetical protein